jgi:hypothetical protein
MVGRWNGVFAAIIRSDRERENGVLCNNSLMRGIMATASF